MKSTLNIKRLLYVFIPATLILFLAFFLLFANSASAGSDRATDELTGYKSILIHSGDTLGGIADRYAKEYSFVSSKEYMECIVKINGLESEYIKEGVYLLLPTYR